MSAGNLTLLVMGLLFVGIITWDVVLTLDNKPLNTISAQMRRLSRWSPWFPIFFAFAMGCLAGHFGWLLPENAP